MSDDRPSRVPKGLLDRGRRTARLGRIVVGAGAKRLLRKREQDDRSFGAALADELDAMKGMAMKVGQILSYMDVPLPDEAQAALARLQRGAQPLAFHAIVEVIEESLGAPVESLFDAVDPEPVAAASIGQVHRGVLAGEPVAIKVRYPGVIETFESDLARMDTLAGLASLATVVDGKAIVAELGARLKEECDYRIEARWQAAFRRAFAHAEGITVPEVISERSTEAVLTSRWIDGLDLEAFAGAPQEARSRAGLRLAHVAWHSLFVLQTANVDPHPGNVLFAPDGAITLLDYGCVRRFDDWFVAAWRELFALMLDGVDGQSAEFARAVQATRMVGGERFDYGFHHEQLTWMLAPYLVERFAFDRAYTRAGYRFSSPTAPNGRRVAIPPQWIWLARLHIGLHSVLARLGSEGEIRNVLRAAISEEPSSLPAG